MKTLCAGDAGAAERKGDYAVNVNLIMSLMYSGS